MNNERKAFWLEISIILLFSLLFALISQIVSQPLTAFEKYILESIAFAFFALLIFVVRLRWKLSGKSAIGLRLKRFFAGAISIFMKAADKLNFFRRQGNVVSGETTVSFDFSVFEKKKAKKERLKPPKWKDMQENRQKLGFLYWKLITERIKKGMYATSHDTPSELKARVENDENEEKLFDLYIASRYDERAPLEEKDILELKDKLFN